MGSRSYYRVKRLNIKGMIFEVQLPLSCMECDSISCFYTLFMYWLEYSMLIEYARYYYGIKLLNTYDTKIPCLQGVKFLKYIYDMEIVNAQHICRGYIIMELLGRKPLSCIECDFIKFCYYMFSDILLIHMTVLVIIKSLVYVMLGEIVLCMHVWNQLNSVRITCVMLYMCIAQIKLMARHHWVNQTKEMVSYSTWNILMELEDLNYISRLPFSCMKCGTDRYVNIKDSCHEAIVVNAEMITYIYYRWLNKYNGITQLYKILDQMGHVVIALIHSNGCGK